MDLHPPGQPDYRRVRAAHGVAGRRHRRLGAQQRATGHRRGAVQPGSRRRPYCGRGGALRRNHHFARPDLQTAGHRRDVRRCYRSEKHRRRHSAEHPRGIHRDGGESEERRARLPGDRRSESRPGRAGRVRQHGADARAVSPFRARHRHYRLQRDEVHRRPRHEHRRGDRRQRPLRLDEAAGEVAAVHRARSVVSRRRCFTRRWDNCVISSPAARTGCATSAAR